jgi:hypothetical protein
MKTGKDLITLICFLSVLILSGWQMITIQKERNALIEKQYLLSINLKTMLKDLDILNSLIKVSKFKNNEQKNYLSTKAIDLQVWDAATNSVSKKNLAWAEKIIEISSTNATKNDIDSLIEEGILVLRDIIVKTNNYN